MYTALDKNKTLKVLWFIPNIIHLNYIFLVNQFEKAHVF